MPELIWDGKYDAAGRRTAPLRVSLPFQTVETVNESAQERQRSFDLLSSDRTSDWRNRLIWGDKKYVLPALLQDFAERVNLIYVDPPFATGANFSFSQEIPDSGATLLKQPSMIEQKAYRDTWGRGFDSYLQWFYEAALLFRDLLAEDGTIYVHIGPDLNHLVRACLDEIFGTERHMTDIIWQRTSAHSDTNGYGVNYDVILVYSKSQIFTWRGGFHEYSEKQKARYRTTEGDDRPFADFDLTQAGLRKGSSGQAWRGYDPAAKGNHWKFDIPTLEEMDREGRVYWPKTGGFPRMKRYLDEASGVPLQSLWTDIFPVNSQAQERVGYPTQKPEALLERIIAASSNEGDLILDCVCGSGTTAVVAEKLNRRWKLTAAQKRCYQGSDVVAAAIMRDADGRPIGTLSALAVKDTGAFDADRDGLRRLLVLADSVAWLVPPAVRWVLQGGQPE